MLIENRSSAKGKFRFCIKRDGIEQPCFDKPSKNMILDAFLNVVNSTASYSFADNVTTPLVLSFRLGTGSTAVSASDTALVNPTILIPNTQTTLYANNGFLDDVTDELVCQQTARGEQEITVAQNLQEIAAYTSGDGTNTGARPILSRALITDSEGAPTSLNVQPGDILVVYYEFETRMPRTVSTTKTISSVDTLIEAVLHSSGLLQFPWADACLGTFFSSSGFSGNRSNHTASNFSFPVFGTLFNPNWTQQTDAITSRSLVSPVAGTRGRRRRIGLEQANGTIRGLYVGEAGALCWIYKFTPAITKTSDDVIELETYMQMTRA